MVEHLLQRSGVLREPVPGRIDFVHRTVQEYLTAKQFADDGDLEPLIAQAHKDQWRETIIMAAGHANAPQRAELLTGLLRRIRTEPRHARHLKLLVAGCLETLPAIPGDLRADVEACLDDLVPPRDLASARSLSNAGEPILDRLPRTPDGLTAAAARAVVRTAWLVNGPDALDLLTGYGKDPREEVQAELVKGWEYFDPDLYARRVLVGTPFVNGHITVPTPRLLPAIRHIKNLTSLSSANGSPSDLSFLRSIGQPLRQLAVSNIQSGDLSPLMSCAESLEELFIGTSSPVTDLTPLSQLRKLKTLGPPAWLTDLTFLRDLPELRALHLGELAPSADLSPLRAHTSLDSLSVDNSPGVTEIDDLPPLDGLTWLSLAGSSLTCGLRELVGRAPKLTTLWLRDCADVTDLSPLEGLNNLRRLFIGGVAPGIDLAPLANNRRITVYISRGQEVRNRRMLRGRIHVD